VIKREIRMIIGSKVPKPEDWVFTDQNHPLLKTSALNAVELSEKSLEEVHQILREDAQEVILATRRSVRFSANKKKKSKPNVTEEENTRMLIMNSP